MRGLRQIVGLMLIAAGLLTGTGCASVPENGNLALVQTNSDKPRAGNVYLLRGWIGIFSRGIDEIGDKLQAEGVRASVFQADQWSELAGVIEAKYAKVPVGSLDREPLVLVGHSYGADNVVRIARHLKEKGIAVDLMVTLDPVTPPTVPSNVARTYNLYQTNGVADALPFLRGIPLSAESAGVRLENVNIRERKDLMEAGEGVDHFNVEKKPLIHKEVIKQVETVCLPRGQWVGMRGGSWSGGAQLAAGTVGPVKQVNGTGSVGRSSNSGKSVSQKAVDYGGGVSSGSNPWAKGGQ